MLNFQGKQGVIMKKFFILLLSAVILFSFSNPNYAQKRKSSTYRIKSYSRTYKAPKISTKSYYKSKSYFNYKIPTYKSNNSFNYTKPTYKNGSTTYIIGDNYKSTGLPKVKRSSSAKHEFLKSKGLKKIPKGYEIDHIIPLSKGGQDTPSNMQLIPKEVHKQKTASERKK